MIVVVGSINVDYTMRLERLPEKGETVLGGSFDVTPGGKGANQAIAAAHFGARVLMVGRVGRDDGGRAMLANFRARGVKTAIKIDRTATGAASILVGKDDNVIGVASGANMSVRPADVPPFKPGSILLCQLEIPTRTVEAILAKAQRAGCFTILDPAPAKKVSLRHVDLITPNRGEAEMLSGKRDPIEAGRALLRRGPEHVIVRLGAKGCVYVGRDTVRHYPAFRVNPVSTVGAGDTFSGALAAALDEGQSLNDAIRFATAAAACKILRAGAQKLPPRREVERMLE
jgi:ribokinase